MQIIFPGMHPLYGGVAYLILLISGLVGVVFITVATVLFIKKIRKRLQIFFFILGLLPMILVIFNILNYHLVFIEMESKVIGTYELGNKFIEFKENNTFNSNNQKLKCKNGTWEYEINEDFDYLLLKCSDENIFRIYSPHQDSIFLSVDVDILDDGITYYRRHKKG